MENTKEYIASRAIDYKKNIAKKFISISPEEMETRLNFKNLYVTRKIDGEFSYLYYENEQAYLCNGYGNFRENIPVLEKIKEILKSSNINKIELAVELHVKENKKRARVFDLLEALANNVGNITISPFDIVSIDDENYNDKDFKTKYDKLSEIFNGEIKPVELAELNSPRELNKIYENWVEKENAEGLVIKNETPIIFKVKPVKSLDLMVIGFSLDEDDLPRQLLVALKNEDNSIQEVGRVGTGFSVNEKKELLELLNPLIKESDYIFIDQKRKTAFFMLEPKVVIEVLVTDILSEYEKIIQNPILKYTDNGYNFIKNTNGIALIHPRFVRIRHDKTIDYHDVRFGQVSDFIFIPQESKNSNEKLLNSKVIFREIYTKKSKENIMVQKYIILKTNKSQSFKYPKYVFHYTNYSPTRKDKLQKEVKISNSKEQIHEIKEKYIKKNIKKGWNIVD